MNTIEENKIRQHIQECNNRLEESNKIDPETICFLIDTDSVIEGLKELSPEIKTLQDYLQYEAWEFYYQAHKDTHGVSPRHTSWKDAPAEYWDSQSAELVTWWE